MNKSSKLIILVCKVTFDANPPTLVQIYESNNIRTTISNLFTIRDQCAENNTIFSAAQAIGVLSQDQIDVERYANRVINTITFNSTEYNVT